MAGIINPFFDTGLTPNVYSPKYNDLRIIKTTDYSTQKRYREAMATNMLAAARAYCPVDTGNMRDNAIRIIKKGKKGFKLVWDQRMAWYMPIVDGSNSLYNPRAQGVTIKTGAGYDRPWEKVKGAKEANKGFVARGFRSACLIGSLSQLEAVTDEKTKPSLIKQWNTFVKARYDLEKLVKDYSILLAKNAPQTELDELKSKISVLETKVTELSELDDAGRRQAQRLFTSLDIAARNDNKVFGAFKRIVSETDLEGGIE